MVIQDVEIAVSLKFSCNFWRALDIPLIDGEINLQLKWSTDPGTFPITDTKIYVPVVTLSTRDNAKLLQQLKPSFKRTIN